MQATLHCTGAPKMACRENRLLKNTSKTVRRLSRVFSSSSSKGHESHESHEDPVTKTGRPSLSPLGAPLITKPAERMRIAVVGDTGSGKTCMLS